MSVIESLNLEMLVNELKKRMITYNLPYFTLILILSIFEFNRKYSLLNLLNNSSLHIDSIYFDAILLDNWQ